MSKNKNAHTHREFRTNLTMEGVRVADRRTLYLGRLAFRPGLPVPHQGGPGWPSFLPKAHLYQLSPHW